jgi:hypothetical protein
MNMRTETPLRAAAKRAAAWSVLFVALGSPARAQPPPRDIVGDSQKLIAAARYDEAVSLIEQAQRGAAPTFELEFMKGVAWQQRAADARLSPQERNGLLARANEAYRSAQALRPASLATLNNRAALAATAGRDQEARDLYGQAVARARETKDPNLETYAINYAEFLRDRDRDAAIEYARVAMQAGSSPASRDLLAELYARTPGALLPFYRTLLDEGRTTDVTGVAVKNVLDETLDADTRREWLNLVAVAMTRDVRARVSYDPQPTLTLLRAARDADPLRVGTRQLEAAVSAPSGRAEELGWWRNSTVGASGVSSRAAMRGLLTAFGEARVDRGGPDARAMAALYLSTAIGFGDRGPDPESFLNLVTLHADAGDKDAITALMNRYEGELFSEKGEAYARGDWPLIYRMHTALGMAYAHLGVWEDTRRPIQSALFQLEHAQTAAAELNRRAVSQGRPATYALPAPAVTKLSETYNAVGRGADAARLRVDSASTLRNLGRINESADLVESLKPADVDKLSTDKRQLYERMRATGRQPNN